MVVRAYKDIFVNDDRDSKLTEFGIATLKDRYLLEGESPQDLFGRVACHFADDPAHAQRLYDYISNLWFMPATPILSNGGTARGLPISCFLNTAPDSLDGMWDVYRENMRLAASGGGIGTYWGHVRSIGESVGNAGKTSGVIPFIKAMDAQTLAVSQGCVDGSTEILTESGWVRFDELNESHGKVIQVFPNGKMEFVTPTEYHTYDYAGPMDHYTSTGKNQKGLMDLFVTPNHRVAYETLSRREGKRVFSESLSIRESREHSFHRDNRAWYTGEIQDDGIELTPQERFLIAYQADGSTNPTGNSNGTVSGSVIYAFRFRKNRKIQRLEWILHECGYSFTRSDYSNGTVSILVRVPCSVNVSKRLRDNFNLSDMGLTKARQFVEEVMQWDASWGTANSGIYFSTERDNSEFIHAVACLSGYKTMIRINEREGRLPRYDVHVSMNLRTIGGEAIEKNSYEFVGRVYCVSVPSGMFLCRRNGHTMVTGNSLRRGSAAVYMQIDHPEIEEFLQIRKPTGGDPNRKCLNLHHGICITDEFMRAVREDRMWALRSPKTREPITEVSARHLWTKILEFRMETGEPYLLFIDTVNRSVNPWHQLDNMFVETSNLCSEITLHTSSERTAVCCLSSLNLEAYPEWKGNRQFVIDVMRFLDNVLQDFVDQVKMNPKYSDLNKAGFSAEQERSVGLGVMGFHSFLQKINVSIESEQARFWNRNMFEFIKSCVDEASETLALEKGACPDAARHGFMERFSNKTAIAPTASISIICGGASAGVEPSVANVYTHKTLSGSYVVRNPYLEKLLAQHDRNDQETWNSIIANGGSVSHLDFLTPAQKKLFHTAFEIDQDWLITHAADRAPMIDQAASNNVFFRPDADKSYILRVHWNAWAKGVKSLYYCRSESLKTAHAVSQRVERERIIEEKNPNDGISCEACQ